MQGISLEELSIHALKNFYKHLQLGIVHLKKCLPGKQFAELLRTAKLPYKQQQYLKPLGSEKLLNFSLVANTFITGTFGGWLGMTSFLELRLGSKFLLITIAILTTVIGSGLGFINFKLAKKEAMEAFAQQKLLILKRKILKIIIQKKTEQLKKIKLDINRQLNFFGHELSMDTIKKVVSRRNSFVNDIEKIFSIIHTLLNKISTTDVFNIYNNKLLIIKKNLAILLSKKKEPTKSNNKLTNKCSYLYILTTFPASSDTIKLTAKLWLHKHLFKLMASFLPAILGAFASMFVYLGGLQNVVNTFELFPNMQGTTAHAIKVGALFIVVMITIYLIYSSFQSNRKAYLRSKIIETTQQKNKKLEISSTALSKELFLLRKIKMTLHTIELIYEFIRIYPMEYSPKI